LPVRQEIMGHSMGGFNAAQIAMSSPESFEKVYLFHPMFPTCDVDSGEIINEDCLSAHIIGKINWKKENPIEKVKTHPIKNTKVFVCEQDEFDLVEGPLLFAKNSGASLDVRKECNHYEYPTPPEIGR